MRVQAVIVGVSKFQYEKNGKKVDAANLYFTYEDSKTEGSRTGSMYVGSNDPDYLMLTDSKNLNHKAQLLQTFDPATKRTNWAFCNYLDK